MKNVLIVFTFLATASAANAGLFISVNGVVNPPDSEINIKASEVVIIDVHSDGTTLMGGFFLNIEGPATYDITAATNAWVPPGYPDTILELWPGLILLDLAKPITPALIPAGKQIDNIMLHCQALGDVTLTLSSGDTGEIMDTQVIHPIPEYWVNLTMQASPNDVNTITPTVGTHTYYPNAVVDINASRFVDCPNVYVFDHWEGDVNDVNSPETTVLMDADKTVTAVFVDGRKCGDECHPYPFGDTTLDCIVDFRDVAMMCLHWLECTKPECD